MHLGGVGNEGRIRYALVVIDEAFDSYRMVRHIRHGAGVSGWPPSRWLFSLFCNRLVSLL